MGVLGLAVWAGEKGGVETRKLQRSAPAEAREVAGVRGSTSLPTLKWSPKVGQLDGLDRRARLLSQLVERLDRNVVVLYVEVHLFLSYHVSEVLLLARQKHGCGCIYMGCRCGYHLSTGIGQCWGMLLCPRLALFITGAWLTFAVSILSLLQSYLGSQHFGILVDGSGDR